MRNTIEKGAGLLPFWLRVPTETAFETAASIRRARVFHPIGVTLRARLEVPSGGGLPDAELFREGRHADAFVRMSHGAGVPWNLPDVLGLAIKVPDAYGAGADQDFLLVSTLSPPIARHLLVPARGFTDLPYSSITFYKIGGRRVLIGARVKVNDGDRPPRGPEDLVQATADKALRIEITAATEFGAWETIASIDPFDVAPAPEGEARRYTPWNTGGGITPSGPVNRLRAAAYIGSQRGRGALGSPQDAD